MKGGELVNLSGLTRLLSTGITKVPGMMSLGALSFKTVNAK